VTVPVLGFRHSSAADDKGAVASKPDIKLLISRAGVQDPGRPEDLVGRVS
jgi:hypothetical protein